MSERLARLRSQRLVDIMVEEGISSYWDEPLIERYFNRLNIDRMGLSSQQITKIFEVTPDEHILTVANAWLLHNWGLLHHVVAFDTPSSKDLLQEQALFQTENVYNLHGLCFYIQLEGVKQVGFEGLFVLLAYDSFADRMNILCRVEGSGLQDACRIELFNFEKFRQEPVHHIDQAKAVIGMIPEKLQCPVRQVLFNTLQYLGSNDTQAKAWFDGMLKGIEGEIRNNPYLHPCIEEVKLTYFTGIGENVSLKLEPATTERLTGVDLDRAIRKVMQSMPEPFRWKLRQGETVDLGRNVSEIDTLLKLAIQSFSGKESEFDTEDRPFYLLYRLRELRLRLMEQKKKNPRMISRDLLNEFLHFMKGLLMAREHDVTEFRINDAFVERLMRLATVVTPYEEVLDDDSVGMELDLFNSINHTTNVLAANLIATNPRLFDRMECSVVFEQHNILSWKLIEQAFYQVLLMDVMDNSIESVARFEKGHKLLALAKAEIMKFHAFDYQTAWKIMGLFRRAMLKRPHATEIVMGTEALMATLSVVEKV